MLNSTASPVSALSGPPYFVDLHVNPGESVSIQLFDGNETILRGPATITMISQHTFPPIPMPVQVPPGHMIQQIVDENGQLRQIILSAHPNGNTNPSNTAILPQQQPQQPQPPFPYCCCCSYSCMGTAQTAPIPPPMPPPPPPQLRHNILTFPTPPNGRRISPMNRTFSPVGKRQVPTYLNNNSIGKTPIRHKFGATTAGASMDGMTKMSFNNNRNITTSDGKQYELNTNRVLVGRMAQNESDCLSFSDPKHVYSKTYNTINQDMIDRGINNKEHMIETNGPVVSGPRPAPPFSYTSLEEHKQLNHSHENTNCSHFESSEKPSILLEINLSSNDSRVQNNISADIVEEVDEEEDECQQSTDICHNQLDTPNHSLPNNINDIKLTDMSTTTDQLLSETSPESLINARLEDKSNEDVCLISEQMNERNNCRNTLNETQSALNDSQSIDCCISSEVQDNQTNDTTTADTNETYESQCQLVANHSQTEPIDSINQNECQLNQTPETGVVDETDYCNELSSDEIHTKDSINSLTKLSDDESEEMKAKSKLALDGVPPLQRSPKHLLPQLELLNLTYTSLTANTVKLKWTYSEPLASGGDNLYAKHFVVEMLLNKSLTIGANGNSAGNDINDGNGNESIFGHNCRVVYQGHSNNCRISHLSSQQQYSFRVRTTGDEHLVVSNALTITTPEQQPINNKFNKKSRRELLQQQIQQQQHQIHQQQVLLQQQQLQHPMTRATDKTEPTITSDQRCAILLLLLFTFLALIVAVLIQQFLSDN